MINPSDKNTQGILVPGLGHDLGGLLTMIGRHIEIELAGESQGRSLDVLEHLIGRKFELLAPPGQALNRCLEIAVNQFELVVALPGSGEHCLPMPAHRQVAAGSVLGPDALFRAALGIFHERSEGVGVHALRRTTQPAQKEIGVRLCSLFRRETGKIGPGTFTRNDDVRNLLALASKIDGSNDNARLRVVRTIPLDPRLAPAVADLVVTQRRIAGGTKFLGQSSHRIAFRDFWADHLAIARVRHRPADNDDARHLAMPWR